jgi:hypothetical protein
MHKIGIGSSLLGGMLLGSLLLGGRAAALPGQSVTEVATWMQANPTIQPGLGETLLVQRSNSPSRRFTFQASITAPGRAISGDRKDIIRSESIALFDTVYGVSQQRLEEALGIIYGQTLYRDYQQANVVYKYPTAETLNRADSGNLPLLRFTQGEVRQGEQFGYWVETVQTPEGKPQNGRITVLLKDDLPKLTAELQNR